MSGPSKASDTYGKELLRRRSPDTSYALGLVAFAAIALPLGAARAETKLQWIVLIAAGLPFAFFFASSFAVRLEIFERVVRVRKLWGTRVIQLSELESHYRRPGFSGRRVHLGFRPRKGRVLQVTVESDDPDDELDGVLETVAQTAPNRPP